MKIKRLYLIIIVIIIFISIGFAYLFLQENFLYKKEALDVDNIEKLSPTDKPFLWKIGEDNPSYLYGSIHIPDINVLTLPNVVVNAIDEVDYIYCETTLDTDSIMKAAELSLLPGDQVLDDLLPEDMSNKLDLYLQSKGVAYLDLSKLKIWSVASYLAQLDLVENYIKYKPLDLFIWNLAVSKNKLTGGIETVKEQIDIFDSFTLEEQIVILNDTINSLEEYEKNDQSPTEIILNYYIDGNLEALQNYLLSDLNESSPLYEKYLSRVIVDRNYNMSKRIIDLITENPDTQYFFTIGAGHYYGNEGILELLKNAGFDISLVDFNECVSCDSGEDMIEGRCYIPYK